MQYNKNQYRKTNEKKTLRKRHKNWIIATATALGVLGVSGYAEQANADTINNQPNQTTETQSNTNEEQSTATKSQSNIPNQSVSDSSSTSQSITSTSASTTNKTSTTTNSLSSASQNSASSANNLTSQTSADNQASQVNVINSNSATNLNAQLQAVFTSSTNNTNQTNSNANNSNQISLRDAQSEQPDVTNSDASNNVTDSNSNHSSTALNSVTGHNQNYEQVTVATHAHDMGYDQKNVIGSAAFGTATISVDDNGNALIGPGDIKDTDIANTSVTTGDVNYEPTWGGVKDKNGNNITDTIKTLQFDHTNFVQTNEPASTFGEGLATVLPNVIAIDYSSTTGWNKMTNMDNMFTNPSSSNIGSIVFGNTFDTSNVTSMNQFIGMSPNLQNVEFGPTFDTTNVKTMQNFIQYAPQLKTVDMRDSNFNLTNWQPTIDPNMPIPTPIFNLNNSNIYLGDHVGKLTATDISNNFINNAANIDLGNNIDMSNVKTMDGAFNDQSLNSISIGPNAKVHFTPGSGLNMNLYVNGHGTSTNINDSTNKTGVYTINPLTKIPGNDAYNNQLAQFNPNYVINTFNWGTANGQIDDRGNALVSNGTINNFQNNSGAAPLSSNVLSQIRTLRFNNVNIGTTDASNMFAGGSSPQWSQNKFNVDQPFINTDGSNNITDFDNLQLLDLSGTTGWDKVTNMYNIFGNSENSTNFNTYSPRLLNTIKWDQNFNTHNVTNMRQAFSNLALSNNDTPLDINSLDTSNVTNMSNMFFNDRFQPATLVVPKFNTHNVTNMDGMFYQVSSSNDLTGFSYDDADSTLDLSHLDFSNVQTTNGVIPESGDSLPAIKYPDTKGKTLLIGTNNYRKELIFNADTPVIVSQAAPIYYNGIGKPIMINTTNANAPMILKAGLYTWTESSDNYIKYINDLANLDTQAKTNQQNVQNNQQALTNINNTASQSADIVKQAQNIEQSMAKLSGYASYQTSVESYMNSLNQAQTNIEQQAQNLQKTSNQNQPIDSQAVTQYRSQAVAQMSSISDYNAYTDKQASLDSIIAQESSAANNYQTQSTQLNSLTSNYSQTASQAQATYQAMTLTELQSMADALTKAQPSSNPTATNEPYHSNQSNTNTININQNGSNSGSNSAQNTITQPTNSSANNQVPTNQTNPQSMAPNSNAVPNNNDQTTNPQSSAKPITPSSTNQILSQATQANDDKHTIKPGVQINNLAHQPYDEFDAAHAVNTTRAINQHRIKYVHNGKTRYLKPNQSMTVQKQVDLGNGKTQVTARYHNQVITFTTNNYNLVSKYYRHGEIQKTLNKVTNFKIKTLRPIRKHTKLNFTDKGTHVKVGSTLKVKRIRVYKHITRFELIDGTSIATSNKLFVKLIK